MSSANVPRLEVTRGDSATVVTITGCRSIVESNAEAIGAELDRVAAEKPEQHLVVDVREIDFISSLGLGKLIGLHGRLRSRRGKLTLRNPRAMVREILAITCLDQVIGIDPPAQPPANPKA
jgi:anti-anti-sigma factor